MKKAPLKRNRLGTTICVAIAVVCLGVAVYGAYLLYSNETTDAGDVAMGLVGAFVFGAFAFMGGIEANCPTCGHEFTFAKTGDYIRCPKCRRYASVESDALLELDDASVSAIPFFAIPLDAGARLPKTCCVCHQPTETLSRISGEFLDTTDSGAVTQTFRRYELVVPHCREHEPQVRVGMTLPDEQPDGGKREPVVRVRSYGFYRAAVGV